MEKKPEFYVIEIKETKKPEKKPLEGVVIKTESEEIEPKKTFLNYWLPLLFYSICIPCSVIFIIIVIILVVKLILLIESP